MCVVALMGDVVGVDAVVDGAAVDGTKADRAAVDGAADGAAASSASTSPVAMVWTCLVMWSIGQFRQARSRGRAMAFGGWRRRIGRAGLPAMMA